MLSNKEKNKISLIIFLLILQIIGYLSIFVLLFLPMTDAILSVQDSQFEIPNYVYPLVSSLAILWIIADIPMTALIRKTKWENQNLVNKVHHFEKIRKKSYRKICGPFFASSFINAGFKKTIVEDKKNNESVTLEK